MIPNPTNASTVSNPIHCTTSSDGEYEVLRDILESNELLDTLEKINQIDKDTNEMTEQLKTQIRRTDSLLELRNLYDKIDNIFGPKWTEINTERLKLFEPIKSKTMNKIKSMELETKTQEQDIDELDREIKNMDNNI